MLETAVLEEIKEYIFYHLPHVLEQDPRFVTVIEGIVAEKFPRRDEFARLLDEMEQRRKQMDQGFADMRQEFTQVNEHLGRADQHFVQVDQHLEGVDQRLEGVDQRLEGVDQRLVQIDQRFEQVDQKLAELSERVLDMDRRMAVGFDRVQVSIDRLGSRWGIRNEMLFRQVIQTLLEETFGVKVEERHIGGEQFDCVIYNGEHILVEIAASVGRRIQQRLERKRQLYIEKTGVIPTRFVLAVGAIHSRQAEALRAAGFEVVEPDFPGE